MFTCVSIIVLALLYLWVNHNKKFKWVSYIKKTDEVLYYREPPFSYSPVIVSYLENLNLEIDKDIIAELLFLAQKGYLTFKKDRYNKHILIRNYEIDTNGLLTSQTFILSKIVSGITLVNFIQVMHKYKVVLEHLYEDDCHTLGYLVNEEYLLKIDRVMPLFIILLVPVIFLVICAIAFFIIQSRLMYDILSSLIKFVGTFYLCAVTSYMPCAGIACIIQNLMRLFDNFILMRTKKAEEDYSKWLAFKDFLNDYTLVKNYDLDSLNVLEHYLTYSVALGVTKIAL